MQIIAFLIVGIVSGWLAGEIVQGGGFGLVGNLIVGIIGAFVGGFILRLFGQKETADNNGIIVNILVSVLGAVVFLFLLNLIF